MAGVYLDLPGDNGVDWEDIAALGTTVLAPQPNSRWTEHLQGPRQSHGRSEPHSDATRASRAIVTAITGLRVWSG